MSEPKNQAISAILIKIAVIIGVVELVIMLVLVSFHLEINEYTMAVIDVVVLAVFSTPPIYYFAVKPFVDARDAALAKINHLAHIDPLMKVANRRMVSEFFEKDMAFSIRHEELGALLLLDLDGVKTVNDQYGHDAGDLVLVTVAERITAIVRAEDIVGRLGGDEFVVIIKKLGGEKMPAAEKAIVIAEKIIEALAKPIDYGNHSLDIGASIGIRLLGFQNDCSDSAMKDADSALYKAKESGKGRAVIFEL